MRSASVAIVGETIVGPGAKFTPSEEERYLRGYNTYTPAAPAADGTIIAAISGVMEVTDCVVSVRGLSPRYLPEVGDVVVGRIVDVIGNKWRVDLAALQDAIMLLSNVTEPGGILRRRGRDDELSMRKLFKEDDVVVAEVQRISPDGLISLHTRTAEKYGKMTANGRLIKLKPSLIRRTRHQFRTFLNYGIRMVIGMNGCVWVELASDAHMEEERQRRARLKEQSDDEGLDDTKEDVDMASTEPEERLTMLALFSNCIEVLSQSRLVVFDRPIVAAVQLCQQQGWRAYDAVCPDNRSAICSAAKEAVSKRKRGN